MLYTIVLLLFGIGIDVESFDCRRTLNATNINGNKVTGKYDLCPYTLTSHDQWSYYQARDSRAYGNVEGGDATNYTFYFNIADNIMGATGVEECDNMNQTWRNLHELPTGYCKNIVNDSCLDVTADIVPITTLTAAYQIKKGGFGGYTDNGCWRLHNGITEPVWSFIDTNNPVLGIQMTYVNGDWCDAAGKNREFTIKFMCADNTQNILVTQTVYEPIDEHCTYEIAIETTRGCPVQCPTIEDKVCTGNGICEYDFSLGEPRCFCYCGWSGSGCNEPIDEDCVAQYNVTETAECTSTMDGCHGHVCDTNGVKAEYDLLWFDLQNDVFTVQDSVSPVYEYMFNMCEPIAASLFISGTAVPRACLDPASYGPCIKTTMIGNDLICDVYKDTTSRVPSAVQVYAVNNETYCYWLGMEMDESDNMESYTVELLDMDDAGRGVIYTVLNGEWCPQGRRNRELRIQLYCPDMNRMEFEPEMLSSQIQLEPVEEIDTCIYELSYSSPLACPINCISRLSVTVFGVCSSHGVCAADPSTGSIRCLCDQGYSGSMCEIDMSVTVDPTYVVTNEPSVSPTKSPLSQAHTHSPTTSKPTLSPLNQRQSETPTTSVSTQSPTTSSIPSVSPTRSPLNPGQSEANTTPIPTPSPFKPTNADLRDTSISNTLGTQSNKSDATQRNQGIDMHMIYIWILIAIVVILTGVIGFCFYQNRKSQKLMENFVLIEEDNKTVL